MSPDAAEVMDPPSTARTSERYDVSTHSITAITDRSHTSNRTGDGASVSVANSRSRASACSRAVRFV